MTHEIIPLNGRNKDLTGQTFGRLTAIAPIGKTKAKQIKWLCICDCGTEMSTSQGDLSSGNTKSCGCLLKDIITTHGLHDSPEYVVMQAMRSRCYNTKFQHYHNYGGRGITICDRWLGSLESFISDMGKRPSSKHTIERRDNNKEYSPDNCYWATRKEQANNRRNNRLLTFQGTTLNVTQWAHKLGMKPNTISSRLNQLGWSVERALTTH